MLPSLMGCVGDWDIGAPCPGGGAIHMPTSLCIAPEADFLVIKDITSTTNL